jgi:hypothetical protein
MNSSSKEFIFIPDFILNFIYKMSILGIENKKEKETNLLTNSSNFRRNSNNKILLELFNYFDTNLLSNKNNKKEEEKYIKKKWYISITFGFLNKNQEIKKEYSNIIKFLIEYTEKKIIILNEDEITQTKYSFDCIKNNCNNIY